MLVEILDQGAGELFHLVRDDLELVLREVNVDSKASLLAVLKSIFEDRLLDGVLRVHEVDDFSPQTRCLHLLVSFVDQCS